MLPDLVDVRWRKSRASGGEGTQCVELAWVGAIRDSKYPAAALPVDVAALVGSLKADRFVR